MLFFHELLEGLPWGISESRSLKSPEVSKVQQSRGGHLGCRRRQAEAGRLLGRGRVWPKAGAGSLVSCSVQLFEVTSGLLIGFLASESLCGFGACGIELNSAH